MFSCAKCHSMLWDSRKSCCAKCGYSKSAARSHNDAMLTLNIALGLICLILLLMKVSGF